jgi:hypothetical protein
MPQPPQYRSIHHHHSGPQRPHYRTTHRHHSAGQHPQYRPLPLQHPRLEQPAPSRSRPSVEHGYLQHPSPARSHSTRLARSFSATASPPVTRVHRHPSPLSRRSGAQPQPHPHSPPLCAWHHCATARGEHRCSPASTRSQPGSARQHCTGGSRDPNRAMRNSHTARARSASSFARRRDSKKGRQTFRRASPGRATSGAMPPAVRKPDNRPVTNLGPNRTAGTQETAEIKSSLRSQPGTLLSHSAARPTRPGHETCVSVPYQFAVLDSAPALPSFLQLGRPRKRP